MPLAAAAQELCAPRDAVLAMLARRYGEVITHESTSSDGRLLSVVTTSRGGATWTWLAIRPDGTACFIAIGKDWHDRPWIDPTPSRAF